MRFFNQQTYLANLYLSIKKCVNNIIKNPGTVTINKNGNEYIVAWMKAGRNFDVLSLAIQSDWVT
jgi:hypothetical protein